MEQPSTVSYSELLLCACTGLGVGLVGQAVGLWGHGASFGEVSDPEGPQGGQ